MLEKLNIFFNKKFMDEIILYFNLFLVDGLFWNKCVLNFIWEFLYLLKFYFIIKYILLYKIYNIVM